MLAGYSFRPRAWAAVLALAACAAGIALGNWQAGRAEQKRALAARYEQAVNQPAIEISSGQIEISKLVDRKIAARGEFVPQHTVLLDNKLRRGRPGYEIVTPLRLADSQIHVLVARGWVQASPRRDVLPELRTPAGEIRIEGIALARLPQALSMGPAQKGRLRQNVDIEQLAAETGIALQPIVLQQHAGPDDGLLRDWPRPDAGVEKHASYALQWYSLAALALVLFVVLSFRRDAKA